MTTTTDDRITETSGQIAPVVRTARRFHYRGDLSADWVVSMFLASHDGWFQDEDNAMCGYGGLITRFLRSWAANGDFPEATAPQEEYAEYKFREWLKDWNEVSQSS